MPLKHTDKGWYWGSQGPFPTKSKALAVARAAYASGYKEQEEMDKMSEFICHLLHCVKVSHVLHLRTRSYAQHVALGDFYEGLDDLTDGLAESYQGKYGKLVEYVQIEETYSDSPLEYLIATSEYVQGMRDSLPPDSEIQNEIDSIQTLINQTIYKLRFLS